MPTLRPIIAALSLLLLTFPCARAATLNVPTLQYPSIQAGIDAAAPGDTVLVADGTYSGPGNVDLDFGGKNITVASVNGAAKTIIKCGGYSLGDGSGNHRGFYIHSGETQAVISGFTVKDGYEDTLSSSTFGGGICIVNSGATIQNCTITGNTDFYGNGGGVYINNNSGTATTTLTNCTISSNTAYNGGGVFSGNDASSAAVLLTNCMLSGNTAVSGGGVYTSNTSASSGSMTLTNCTISGNKATGSNGSYGGGVYNSNYNSNATITLASCTINGSTAQKGGGVYNENSGGSAAITLTDCAVTGNTAAYDAGGVYSENLNSNSAITLTGCAVTGNTASSGSGGGVYTYIDIVDSSVATATLTNCVISGNTATYGGGVYNDNYNAGVPPSPGNSITLTNCTMSGNTATNKGGGAYNANSPSDTTIALTNCILYNDVGKTSGSELAGGTNIDFNFCDIQGGSVGTGNINADPLFVRTPNTHATPPNFGDLRPKPGSPCLGAGTATGAPATDKDARLRPHPPSIGAYEVALIDTSTTLTSSINPSTLGQSIVFTATITSAGVAPAGTMTFTIDGTAQTPVTLNNGAATYSTASLAIGAHTLTASYSGDAAFAPSVSPTLTQTVSKAATTTTLTSSLNPSAYGQSVTFTAAVTGSVPTGTITFTDTTSGTALGTKPLLGAAAAITITGLTVGSHQITALYSGDASNAISASAPLTQTVQAVGTTTTLASSLNPSISGQSVTFTASVSAANGVAAGSVTFTIDGTAQTPSALSNGAATYGTSSLSVGAHSITAAYSGNATFASSVSAALTQSVSAHVTPQYVSLSGSDGNPGTLAAPKLTIQAAINVTLAGDTVIVEDGTYLGPGNVDIDFGGRNITVKSMSGAAKTIIDCQDSSSNLHRGFYFHSGETAQATVNGFTIQNGNPSADTTGNSAGGGIDSIGSSPMITNCIFTAN